MLRVLRVHRAHVRAFQDKRGAADREKPGLSTGLTDSLGPAGGVVQEVRAITLARWPPPAHPSKGPTALARKGDSLGVEQAWGLAVRHVAGEVEAREGLGAAGALVEVDHGHEVGDAGGPPYEHEKSTPAPDPRADEASKDAADLE